MTPSGLTKTKEMKHHIQLIIGGLLLSILPLFVTAQDNYEHKRVRVFGDHEEIHQLEEAGLAVCGTFVREGAYAEGDFSPYEMNIIEESNLEYKVLHENASDYYTEMRKKVDLFKASGTDCSTEDFGKYETPENFTLGSLSGFYTYQEILDHLDLMHELYPELIAERTPIGDFKTHEDRFIYHTTITGPSDQEKEQILYTGIHHAREPMSVTQMIYYMWYLLENYDTDPAIQYIVDNRELFFVPCINPDGYIYNEEQYEIDENGEPDFSFWRKNKRDNNGDGQFNPFQDGVDLNRNYGFFWGLDNQGSSTNPGSDVYRGPDPFSEPETQAIQFLCESNEFITALNYHSHGDLLIYPWGYTASLLTPDSTIFRNFTEILTLENDYFAGTGNETVGYVVNGDSDDWMYGEQTTKNKILAMTPEVGPSEFGFYPPESEIINICQLNLFQNLGLARVTNTYGYYQELSDLDVSGEMGALSLSIKQTGLEAGAFTINVTALSDAVTLAESSITTAVLENDEEVSEVLDYTIEVEGLENGTPLDFYIEIDNGIFTYGDTIEKVWFSMGVEYDYAFIDSCQELGNWENTNLDWGLSALEYYSAPSSLTESPASNYLNDHQSFVIYNDVFDFTDYVEVEMAFWAKWDIEEGYDYVQLSAIVLPEMTELPLCGNYTSINGSIEEPVYDGIQADWVQERIDLSEFAGQQIRLKYEFYSDGYVNGDGFYLDDLEILARLGIEDSMEVVDTMVTDTSEYATAIEFIQETNSLSNPVPNPSDNEVRIEYNWQIDNDLPNLVFVNQLGQKVFEQKLETKEGSVNVKVAEWVPSIYFYYLESENSRSDVKRLMR